MNETVHESGITRDEYRAYEGVRASGITNMYAVRTVEELTGITSDRQAIIRENYESLMAFYPDTRK